MPKIKIIKSTVIAGKRHRQGSIAETTEPIARQLVGAGQAERHHQEVEREENPAPFLSDTATPSGKKSKKGEK